MRDGWRRTTLGEVVEQVRRGKAPAYVETGGLMVASQKCVRQGLVDLSLARRTDPSQRPVPDWALLQPGDVLVNSTGRGTLGRTSVFRGNGEPVTVDSHVTIVRADPTVVAGEFLGLLLFVKQGELESYQTGSTTQTELSRDTIRNVRVDLPPLAEQRRIVDLIGAINATGQAATESAASADEFRDAVESSVASGEWPASTVALGDIADVVGGITKDSKRDSVPDLVEVPYLRVANVQRGYLDLAEVVTMRVPRQKAAQLTLEPGDILFNEGGDRDKLGRGAIWEGQMSGCVHQNHVLRARLHNPEFDPRFVSIWGNTFGKGWFEAMGSQTTNLASLNLSTLRAFPIPKLPLDEQREIAARSTALREVSAGARALAASLAVVRARMLEDLLSGVHEIPRSYDRLLESA